MGCLIIRQVSILAFILTHLNVHCNNSITKSSVQEKSKRIVVENCQDSMYMKTGDTLDIKLKGYLARGYSWQLKNGTDSVNAVVKFFSKKSESHPNSNDDSEQITTFTFIMLDKSSYFLQFVYKRP